LFGHRVLSERLAVKSGNPVLTSNLLEFYRECVAPDLATGYIRMKEDILEVNNVWVSLNGKTNPARLVTLRDTTDPTIMSTVGCDVGYQSLTTQITAESSRQITLLGSRLYPKMSQADAGTAIVGSLATSTNYLLGVSASAQDAVKQAIVANFMIDAQYMLPAQLGDAASAQTNLAMAQSLRSTSDSYKLMARVAESTMPKVRNAIELVQYAIFPVFLLFVVLSGHQAGTIIKSYAASLFWIQLWAPLYAVMNFIITMYSRSQYTNGSAGSGLSIEQMSFLNTAIVSDQAIAGMLVISIPAIAAAIVKGGEVGLQSVAGLVAPPRDPEKIASALAMGNMQMGNASLNNVSHDTMKGLAVDMNPSLRQGMTNYQARGGFDYSHFSGGGFVVKQAKKRCPRRHGAQRFRWVPRRRRITNARSRRRSSNPRSTLKVLSRHSSRRPALKKPQPRALVTRQATATAWGRAGIKKPMKPCARSISGPENSVSAKRSRWNSWLAHRWA
jgi:hypothetical protein